LHRHLYTYTAQFISPAGRHCDAAGELMFYRRFECRPFHSTSTGRIATRIVALTLSMKEFILWLKIWSTSVEGHCRSKLQPILWCNTATSWH